MVNSTSKFSIALDALANPNVNPYSLRARGLSSDVNNRATHDKIVADVTARINLTIDEHIKKELMKLGWIPPEMMLKYKLVLKDEKEYETK